MIFEFDEKTMEAILQDFLSSKMSPMFYVKDMVQENNRRITKHHISINRCIDPLYDGSKGESEEGV